MRNPFRMTGEEWQEFILMLVVAVLGCVTLWRAYTTGVLYFDADTRSHLNVARMVLDNVTPGFNQLGIWNPLLHILLLPFIWHWTFYVSGVAGACLLLPCFLLSVLLMRRLIVQLTDDSLLGFIAGLLLAIHPYALFFAVVPMTEMLQMTCIIGATYFFARWLNTDDLKSVLFSGVFAALACMARFESLGLAFAMGLVVVVHSYRNKKSFAEIFALSQLFWLVALLGIAYLVAYGWFYIEGPMSFLGLTGSPGEGEQKTFEFTMKIVSHGLFHLQGLEYLILGIVGSVFMMCFCRWGKYELYLAFILINPLLVVFYALYTKPLIIWVPELPRLNSGPPIGYFAGVRFLLSTTPFILVAVMLFIHRARVGLKRVSSLLAEAFTIMLLVVLIGGQVARTYQVERDAFPAMQKSPENKLKMHNHLLVADYLRENYDHGLILYYRQFSDIVQFHAQLPLKDYIYTANYPLFDQAVRFPWLFVRWAIIPTSLPESAQLYIDMKYSDTFNKYFEKVLIVPPTELVGFTVYRLREDLLTKDLTKMGVNLARVPSLWHEIRPWDTYNVNENLVLKGTPWNVKDKYPKP